MSKGANVSWFGFAAVFVVFLVTHSVPTRPAVKTRIVRQIGAAGFGISYSVLSLVMLGWLIWAAGQAPYLELWPQMPWHRAVVQSGMFVVCILAANSIGRPNPLSFGGARNQEFDPHRPGIVRWTRHPILTVLVLWAGLHILPNGDLAHVLLFGSLGVFALMGHWLIDGRKKREIGPERWAKICADIKRAPLFAKPSSWPSLVLRLTVGTAVYTSLSVAHPYVFGVAAFCSRRGPK